ncbi:glycosyltransferase family 25 protein [Mycobacterium kansasii]
MNKVMRRTVRRFAADFIPDSLECSFAIGIVAHHSRLDQAKQLHDEVQADVLMVDDTNRRLGCEANHRRVWAELATIDTDWSVVLEDDAVPVPNFRNQLTQALSVAPTPFVSLYLGQGFPRQWQHAIRRTLTNTTPNTCWITCGWMLHAVGIAIRSTHIPAMLDYLSTHTYKPVDQAIGHHVRTIGHHTAYTLPSLVDHADGPSVHQHQDGIPRTLPRKAWRTGTRDVWTSRAIEMARQ